MTVNWLDADRAALPAVLEELTSEERSRRRARGSERFRKKSGPEEPAPQEESGPDDVPEPAEPPSSVRPKISRRWPRR